MVNISLLKEKILNGNDITSADAISLQYITPEQLPQLLKAAEEISAKYCPRTFDSCSIINARSGKCSENCKWCAQSAHFKTSADEYPLISREVCLNVADHNRRQGVKRFSLVTSGRKMSGADLAKACSYYKELHNQGGIELCASMGLLDRDELLQLRDSGVTRYHCNLEAAPSFFPSLCSTHTIDDKIRTIKMAREIGMEVCSGGIIGMGETRLHRIELALKLREVEPESIPINILCPIPGTPLEGSEPLSTDEVLCTIAIFRFIHPRTILRFAGGRASLPREAQLQAIRIGMNGGVVGDLLTTIGSKVAEDKKLVAEGGYDF